MLFKLPKKILQAQTTVGSVKNIAKNNLKSILKNAGSDISEDATKTIAKKQPQKVLKRPLKNNLKRDLRRIVSKDDTKNKPKDNVKAVTKATTKDIKTEKHVTIKLPVMKGKRNLPAIGMKKISAPLNKLKLPDKARSKLSSMAEARICTTHSKYQRPLRPPYYQLVKVPNLNKMQRVRASILNFQNNKLMKRHEHRLTYLLNTMNNISAMECLANEGQKIVQKTENCLKKVHDLHNLQLEKTSNALNDVDAEIKAVEEIIEELEAIEGQYEDLQELKKKQEEILLQYDKKVIRLKGGNDNPNRTVNKKRRNAADEQEATKEVDEKEPDDGKRKGKAKKLAVFKKKKMAKKLMEKKPTMWKY